MKSVHKFRVFLKDGFPYYDKLSDQGCTSLSSLDKSESGQMVSEKVKVTYFDVYLSQTM